jgi:hypothetical protein
MEGRMAGGRWMRNILADQTGDTTKTIDITQ